MENELDFEKLVIKKASSEGPEWAERRNNEQADSELSSIISSRDIFGYALLTNWEIRNGRGEIWERLKRIGAPENVKKSQLEAAEKSYPRKLETFQKQMIELAKRNPEGLEKMITRYLKSDADITGLIKKYEYDNEQDIEDRKDLLDRLAHRNPGKSREELEREYIIEEISDLIRHNYAEGNTDLGEDVIIPMLEHHANEVMAVEDEIKKEVAEFQEKMRPLLDTAIEHGKFPLNITSVKERLDTLQIKVVDGVIAKLAEKWGDFDAQGHTIRFSSEAPKDKRWPIYVHEVFHALSGQIENVQTPEGYDEDPNVSHYEHLKIGTRFLGTRRKNPEGLKPPNLHWLNEALTEEVTVDLLLSGHQTWAYKNERMLLKKLIDNNIPKKLLYSAYFENYDVTKPEGEHRLPKTRELFDLTNKKFGTGFLVDLDKFVKRSGVREALRVWDQQKENFPEYLKDLLI